MKRRPLVSTALRVVWIAAALTSFARAPARTAAGPSRAGPTAAAATGSPHRDPAVSLTPGTVRRPGPATIAGVLDTGQFLPDTTVLARVNDRVIRAGGFVDAYFSSAAEVRPNPDSLGRVEFLTSMIDKEVLALTALAIGRPLGFEDRATLRGHTQTVLSNVLYQRAVLDSAVVTDEEVSHAYRQFGRQLHLRDMVFQDRATAEQAHDALVAGRITWREAVRRSAPAGGVPVPDGDLGWVSRRGMSGTLAVQVFDLAPGEISPPLPDRDGYHVMQALERRDVEPPPFERLREELVGQLRLQHASARAGRLQAQVGEHIGLVHDTSNIAWAAARLRGGGALTRGRDGPVLDLSGRLPEFSPADTARVLATQRDGRFTLGDFLREYQAMPPLMRPSVGDIESFRTQLDGMMLAPYMAELARTRGLEQDPLAVAMIERKREEILVQHLYEDSVDSQVRISPEERRRYYDDHVAQYTTFPEVRFASIIRDSKAAADSLLARLRAGERAADILRADSLQGLTTGSIRTRRQDEPGPYHQVLFEELRPGQATASGPDQEGVWIVLQLLEFDPGRPLTYQQAERYVIESVHNLRAEARLKAFIARQRRRYRIEAHPELVMRVRLVVR
jgi:hypothetical protein